MAMPSSKGAVVSEQKVAKGDERHIEADVLSAVQAESHRTSAIVNVLHGKYDYNAVLRALVSLQKEGKVEKESKKAWIAKGKVSAKEKEGGKGKESRRAKEVIKEAALRPSPG